MGVGGGRYCEMKSKSYPINFENNYCAMNEERYIKILLALINPYRMKVMIMKI